MRLLLAVIGACLALSGCDKNQGQVQTQAEKELETWKALCTMEKANGEKLQSALNAERAANVDWPKKFQSAQDQADQLKAQLLAERAAAAREIARLKNELDGAKSAAAASAEQASPGGKSATGGKAAPASATAGQIASAENAVADLQ
ncbi:MAG: hypothetical protein NT049_05620, partial [Planctomycetota bacterium]|nr:hypothetical protein [Planctomycetota bacterium]